LPPELVGTFGSFLFVAWHGYHLGLKNNGVKIGYVVRKKPHAVNGGFKRKESKQMPQMKNEWKTNDAKGIAAVQYNITSHVLQPLDGW
jgi:hypothetical protein